MNNTNTTPATTATPVTPSIAELISLGKGAALGEKVLEIARAVIRPGETLEQAMPRAAEELFYELEQAAEEANMVDLAEALEDIPEVEPPAVVTRVDALVALGRTVLEKRENQLTPHEIHRGWALLHKANELLEKLGSPGDYLDDFLYTAAYEWIEQEATERLRELWELPKTELFNISERGYHLRELLMSFYEEAYGRPEEAIYLLREFIGR